MRLNGSALPAVAVSGVAHDCGSDRDLDRKTVTTDAQGRYSMMLEMPLGTYACATLDSSAEGVEAASIENLRFTQPGQVRVIDLDERAQVIVVIERPEGGG